MADTPNDSMPGVALVDQFAMAALTGIIMNLEEDASTDHVAKSAYAFAESMMHQRLKRTDSRYGKKKHVEPEKTE